MLSLFEFVIWSEGDFVFSIFNIDYSDISRSRALIRIERTDVYFGMQWSIDFLFFHIK